jgi:hypothetical protein
MVALSLPNQNLAKKGFYWNYLTGETARLDRSGTLPAGQRKHSLRLPTPLLLLASPILGFLFVMFLPLVAIVMVMHAPVQALRLRARARAAAPALVSPSAPQEDPFSPAISPTE